MIENDSNQVSSKQIISNFILNYQKYQQDVENRKQKLKHNIMLDIMSNKYKKIQQSSQNTTYKDNSSKQMTSIMDKNDIIINNTNNQQQHLMRSFSIPSNAQKIQSAEQYVFTDRNCLEGQITFNRKSNQWNRPNSEETPSYQAKPPQQVTFRKSQQMQLEFSSQKWSKINKAANKDIIYEQEVHNNDQISSNNNTNRNYNNQDDHQKQQINLNAQNISNINDKSNDNVSRISKKNQNSSQFQSNRSISKNSEQINSNNQKQQVVSFSQSQDIRTSQHEYEQSFRTNDKASNIKEQMNNNKNNKTKSYQYQYQESEHQQQNDDQPIHQDNQASKGIFLTIEASESVVADEKQSVVSNNTNQKNCTFQVVLQNQDSTDNLQELKRRKILSMEKKRHERLVENKKIQNKKPEIPKPKQLTNLQYKKVFQDKQIECQMPKTTQIDRKMSNKSPFDRNKLTKGKSNLKNNYHQRSELLNGSDLSQKNSLNSQYRVSENEGKNLSPYSNKKIIRKNPSLKAQTSIRDESPHQISTTRISTTPKIQPKDLKNTFLKQSNKKLMMNAITYTCLPGELNRKEREKFLEVFEQSQYEYFILLFKEYSRKVIKGIYILQHNKNDIIRIYGEKVPAEINGDYVNQFYRYDSGSREFKKLDGCKSFSLAVHAIDIK